MSRDKTVSVTESVWHREMIFTPRQAVSLPSPDIQLAAVDDTGELKQDGKPAPNPHAVSRSHVHVVTGVFPQGLHKDTNPQFDIT